MQVDWWCNQGIFAVKPGEAFLISGLINRKGH